MVDFSQMTAANLYGLNPGGQSGAPASTPIVSHAAGDNGAVPWHPDSHAFWLIGIGVLTAVGILGASFNVRAGHARAGASIGKV